MIIHCSKLAYFVIWGGKNLLFSSDIVLHVALDFTLDNWRMYQQKAIPLAKATKNVWVNVCFNLFEDIGELPG